MAPQVLVDVNHSMRVMTEESFGPVIGIMKVDKKKSVKMQNFFNLPVMVTNQCIYTQVKSDEEAIQLMNDSEFGLTASIWTKDADAAIAIGNEIDTGTWFMNRCDCKYNGYRYYSGWRYVLTI